MPFYRQFIIYLMIAVFFNTAIGVPLHAAEHAKGAGALMQGKPPAAAHGVGLSPAQPAAHAAATTSPSEPAELTTPATQLVAFQALERDAPDTRPDTHTPSHACAVCAAHAHHATAFVIWPMAPPAAPASLCGLPSCGSPEIAEAGQWPFAARDPPRA